MPIRMAYVHAMLRLQAIILRTVFARSWCMLERDGCLECRIREPGRFGFSADRNYMV